MFLIITLEKEIVKKRMKTLEILFVAVKDEQTNLASAWVNQKYFQSTVTGCIALINFCLLN